MASRVAERGNSSSCGRRSIEAGRPIGANDLLIAAHARSVDAILVTNNAGEFNRVPDLRVENWL